MVPKCILPTALGVWQTRTTGNEHVLDHPSRNIAILHHPSRWAKRNFKTLVTRSPTHTTPPHTMQTQPVPPGLVQQNMIFYCVKFPWFEFPFSDRELGVPIPLAGRPGGSTLGSKFSQVGSLKRQTVRVYYLFNCVKQNKISTCSVERIPSIPQSRLRKPLRGKHFANLVI